MPDMEVSFEVYCTCGNGLCATTRVSYNRGIPQIVVEPCEKCLAQEYDKGYDNGYDKGSSDSEGG